MTKTIIGNFKKQENETKVTLLNEIKKEFESYETDCVVLSIEGENEDLDSLIYSISPYKLNKYCQIDATAMPCYICRGKGEFRLYITGETTAPDTDYITLEEPYWGLDVDSLYSILLLLKDPIIKNHHK